MFGVKSDDLIGYWITENKDLIVQVYSNDNQYSAKITWFKDDKPSVKKYSEHGISKDKWLNHQVLYNFKKESDNKWTGKIFDVKYGKEYDAIIIKENDKLIVTGYVLLPIFGRELIFHKYKSSVFKTDSYQH